MEIYFMAQQRNATRCKTCKTETGREVKCAQLTLNIEENQIIYLESLSGKNNSWTTIEMALTNYAKWENLSKGNEYDCPK